MVIYPNEQLLQTLMINPLYIQDNNLVLITLILLASVANNPFVVVLTPTHTHTQFHFISKLKLHHAAHPHLVQTVVIKAVLERMMSTNFGDTAPRGGQPESR